MNLDRKVGLVEGVAGMAGRLVPLHLSHLLFFAPLAFLVWASPGCGTDTPQPIRFNHKLHVEKVGMDCSDCHRSFKTQSFSGIPDHPVCMECHETAQTQSAEEEKIRQYAKNREPIPWRRIYEVPSHVFYSHRRHVVVAGIECKTCHGPIAETEAPPGHPLNKLTMNFCMDCHRKQEQSIDCITCHR